MACITEFPDEPARTVTIRAVDWRTELAVTDVDTLEIEVRLGNSDTLVTALRVTWQSSDDAVLRVVQLRPPAGASREDTLATQRRAEVTGQAGGLVVVSAVIEGGEAFEPETINATIRVTQKWVSVSAGYEHSCGVTVDSNAFCWGERGRSPEGGFLGNGTSAGSLIPAQVIGGLDFQSVTTGDRHSCGVLVGGRVYCWGLNTYGAVGNGSSFGFHQFVPVLIAVGRTFTSVTAGAAFVCGVGIDAQGFCWGLDDVGQLGDGGFDTILGRPVPRFDNCSLFEDSPVRCSLTPRRIQSRRFEPIPLLAVGAGMIHACGIRTDKVAVCWGSGSVELGRPSATQTDTAVVVPGETRFESVSVGLSHACGLATPDSTAYCWGYDSYGQLGIADPIQSCDLFSGHQVACSRTPVAVSVGFAFRVVSAGGNATCGIRRTDSTAYCWGSNEHGQLGTANEIDHCVPDIGVQVDCSQTPVRIQVPGDARMVAVSVGAQHACGVKVAGPAYCWGNGEGGKLGNDSTKNSSVPVRVLEPR